MGNCCDLRGAAKHRPDSPSSAVLSYSHSLPGGCRPRRPVQVSRVSHGTRIGRATVGRPQPKQPATLPGECSQGDIPAAFLTARPPACLAAKRPEQEQEDGSARQPPGHSDELGELDALSEWGDLDLLHRRAVLHAPPDATDAPDAATVVATAAAFANQRRTGRASLDLDAIWHAAVEESYSDNSPDFRVYAFRWCVFREDARSPRSVSSSTITAATCLSPPNVASRSCPIHTRRPDHAPCTDSLAAPAAWSLAADRAQQAHAAPPPSPTTQTLSQPTSPPAMSLGPAPELTTPADARPARAIATRGVVCGAAQPTAGSHLTEHHMGHAGERPSSSSSVPHSHTALSILQERSVHPEIVRLILRHQRRSSSGGWDATCSPRRAQSLPTAALAVVPARSAPKRTLRVIAAPLARPDSQHHRASS